MDCFNGLTFTFDGKSSELFGLYMGWREASEDWNTGLDRELVKSEFNMIKPIPNLYGATYTDPLLLEFDIFHQNGSPFSYQESRHINNWLIQDTYKKFMVDNNNVDNVFYKVICTAIQDVTLGNFNGKHVTMTCDSPFGYSREIVKTVKVDGAQPKQCHINNASDAGVYSPVIKITCDGDYNGNMELTNQTAGQTMILNFAEISPVDGKKFVRIDTGTMLITDVNGNIIPLYKLGWSVEPNEQRAIPSSELYIFRLVPGLNEIEIKGTGKVEFNACFPRKAGQLNEL